MLKFICPSCHTENLLNEGANSCFCSGCSLVHRITPELTSGNTQGQLRDTFDSRYFKGDLNAAFEAAIEYDNAIQTIPSHYMRECLAAMTDDSIQPSDALVEQFIMLGFSGHRRMLAWKVIETWLKTKIDSKFYRQWLMALSEFYFKHKVIFDESQYSNSARAELNRGLTIAPLCSDNTGIIAKTRTTMQKPLLSRLLSAVNS